MIINKIKFKNSLFNKLINNYNEAIKEYKLENPIKADEYFIRIGNALNKYLPFIKSLKNSEFDHILEIGSGYGSVSIGLSTLTKKLTCLDINEKEIKFLKNISFLKDAEIIRANSDEFDNSKKIYDLIVYSASLEHMTLYEREEYLRKSWDSLKDGGFIVILECPNLYWYKENHSTQLLFNGWLQNEIAFKHTKNTKRKSFQNLYIDFNDNLQRMDWLRRGRPVSYEEIKLFIGLDENKNKALITSMEKFLGWRFTLRRLTYGIKYNIYSQFLKSLRVEEGFRYPFFNIAIKKLK